MPLIEKIKSVLLHPTKFFESLKKEKGVKTAFRYYLILSFISFILGTIITFTFNKYIYSFWSRIYGWPFPIPPLTLETIVLSPFIWYLVGLGLSFIAAGILHVWILIFGGKEEYSKTYQLWAYSLTPGFVFGWIPFLGFFAFIYDLFLLILGTQKLHGISKNLAILMYVIPIALFVIFMIICMMALFMFIGANPGLFQNLTYNST
jgi:hypothetical protein